MKRIYKREKAQSFVEFAIGFLMLVLIVAAIVDGGRMFVSYMALRDAAEEGAIYASINPSDADGTIARVRDTSDTPVEFSDTSKVSVAFENIGPACAGNKVRVTISYDFLMTMPLIGVFLENQQFPLETEATATVLSPVC